ncbi:hypothetical protein M3223_17105 [Paenibacillus pasadenensis]|uniref:hypothetical protein n=1 Tax=Paenibacillus pasadenensis TaxID=217090 RepID=UPI00203ECFCF|nr:hypothetical protein [Paenibacillus pasadenensis]MCM3749077.1 hypothetical protein [Paenibacillus pasadenensis]
MEVYESWGRMIYAATYAGQILIVCGLLFVLLKRLTKIRPRWLHLQPANWKTAKLPEHRLRYFGLNRSSPMLLEREKLFAGCGWIVDAAYYAASRRIGLSVIPGLAMVMAVGNWLGFVQGMLLPVYVWLLLAVLIVLLLADKSVLQALRLARTARVVREIHTVSTQLLYLQGSSLHIHAKLMRCVPYTRTIRRELQHLLGEWYHDAGSAIREFKERIGTEDVISFAETIDSLRQHEDEAYYELLRARIRDYKEKLETMKESRKESSSYVLFIIAGIPILYTFQVFIYPWVRESQKLFDSLN